MHSRIFPFKEIGLFLSFLLIGRLWRKFSYQKDQTSSFQFLAERHDEELSKLILVFSVEGALLKSSNLFPYFMLVAFEAGSPIRASVLFAFYPIICLVNQDLGLKIMVMICFLGIRQDSFTAGRAVLPKFLLEDVGLESFEVLRRGGKKIGVTDLPLVMVESFLREYLMIDSVVGKEVKVFCGYFLGIMEKKQRSFTLAEDNKDNMVGITSCFNESLQQDHLFSRCKEIYMVSEEEKRQWKTLSRDMYPRPLIFHDGRLAFKPGFVEMLVTFMWFPIGLILSIVRIVLGFFPYGIALPISAFSGIRLRFKNTGPPKSRDKGKGRLYICNHRTLLDPVFLSVVLQTSLTAVTYSLSRLSEILSPIKTVRLTRDAEKDAKIIDNLLSKGNYVVVCPEGTTCREPYLLRFSPLFADLRGGEIVTVAVDACVSMFYGTTAGGLKCLDPFFFLMNPCPAYAFEFLDTILLPPPPPPAAAADHGSLRSKYEVANLVQSELGKALGFACTQLTRKDKYLFLTGR